MRDATNGLLPPNFFAFATHRCGEQSRASTERRWHLLSIVQTHLFGFAKTRDKRTAHAFVCVAVGSRVDGALARTF
jgi:hypothetical protein